MTSLRQSLSLLIAATATAALLTGCSAPGTASDKPAAAAKATTPELRQTLAPGHKLRVGVYRGSPSSIVEGATPADARGVGYDLGREMATRLGVAFEPVVFANNAGVLAAVKAGQVDVVFTNATTARARDMDFSQTFMDVEKSFLVIGTSPLMTIADTNRAGLRIGVSEGSSTAGELAVDYRQAEIVPTPTLKMASEWLASGKLDAFATNNAILFEMSDGIPGSRVLPGRWGMEHFAVGIPKGRDAGLRFVRDFVDTARREGLVDKAVKRAGLRGTVAATAN